MGDTCTAGAPTKLPQAPEGADKEPNRSRNFARHYLNESDELGSFPAFRPVEGAAVAAHLTLQTSSDKPLEEELRAKIAEKFLLVRVSATGQAPCNHNSRDAKSMGARIPDVSRHFHSGGGCSKFWVLGGIFLFQILIRFHTPLSPNVGESSKS